MSNSSEDEEVKEASKEDSPKTGKIEIPLKQISQLDWSTSQVSSLSNNTFDCLLLTSKTLELIDADFSPALVMIMNSEDSKDTDWKSLAIQCRFLPNQTGTSCLSAILTLLVDPKEDTLESVQKEWETLGKLEYFLHLMLLETRHKDSHTRIPVSLSEMLYFKSCLFRTLIC